ncbi:MAG: hypothetical protein PHV07_07175 [Oscillospiraceae bacterium]|nr:hypothetical protein [Oscillospiraceae bacterium]
MRQGGGRRRAIARRERQRSLANKRPRRLVDFYLELVLIYSNYIRFYDEIQVILCYVTYKKMRVSCL